MSRLASADEEGGGDAGGSVSLTALVGASAPCSRGPGVSMRQTGLALNLAKRAKTLCRVSLNCHLSNSGLASEGTRLRRHM